MVTRLRIDLINKVLEVEGEESFVRQIYGEFKEGVVSDKTRPKTHKPATKKKRKRTQVGTGNKRNPQKSSLKILGELNLMGDDKNPSLNDFFDKYEVKSHFDNITLCVYYLKHVEGVSTITANHVYTCYRKLKLSLPKFFSQALTDTKNQKAFIEISADGTILLTNQGLNQVEHVLGPKATTGQ